MNRWNSLALILVGFVALVLVLFGICGWHGFFKQKISYQDKNAPVIGDLGGVPVSIPRPYAWFVEYHGDPGWFAPRKEAPPKRTYQSKLASFGFEARYPDMAPVNDQTWSERNQSTPDTSMWLRVGVDSRETSHLFLERLVNYIPQKLAHRGPNYRFERQSERVYDLLVFNPVGSGNAYSAFLETMDNENIYYHLDNNGRVDTYIECVNAGHRAAPCTQFFLLTPAMNARVQVSYRIGQLGHWREIKESVTRVILGFKTKPDHFSSSL